MNLDLYHQINAFSNFHVAVLGEAMLDGYLEGRSDRLCREAPVPVVVVNDRHEVPGGAANTAVNIRSLGARSTLLSVVGNDIEGKTIKQILKDRGISVEHLLHSANRGTLAKHRVIAGAQMVVRFDQGSTEDLHPKTEQALIEHLIAVYPTCDALIISDYGYGIITQRVIEAIRKLQAENPKVLVIDSKNLPRFKDLNPSAVKPNYPEALRLLDLPEKANPGARPEWIVTQADRILDITGAQICAVTLDEDGAVIIERGQAPYRTYAKPASYTRAAGAGDTFISALALSLVAGSPTPTAAEIASAAASVVVGKEGTSACEVDDLRAYFAAEEKFVTDAFYLAARIASYRREGKKIVFTNGCFDILHRGHIAYLNNAKSFGDVLIVGLNTDSSVRRLKGPNRPINSLDDRAQILAALSCVDHIISFDGDTPADLIRIIRPDIFVKGGDYTLDRLPEAALVETLGGTVKILPYVPDRSTSGMIARIRKLYAEAD